MPNRILKESICTSDSIDGLSWFEEVLFYRLMVSCDDFGRFDGRAAIIKNRLFPLKENLTIKAVSAAINTLASKELVALYEFEGKPYLCLPTWNEHQTIRAKKSKYPAPTDGVKSSEINCKQMHADAPVIQSNAKSNPNPNPNAEDADKPHRTRFVPPTVEQVADYCKERGNKVDPQRFVDYYTANGWKTGRNPMKDWRAAVRNWEKNGFDTPQKKSPNNMAGADFNASTERIKKNDDWLDKFLAEQDGAK